MCGIAGYIGNQCPDDRLIQHTLDLMKRRGPDCQRVVRFTESSKNAVLLHSRLSIIDLDHRSDQPFSIGNCTIVYNGEIYNYLELRQQLQEMGVVFRTASDTEVLLQSYLHYGPSCVERFEGMWSFAIYDNRNGVLFLSRDRFGEKPLYCFQTDNGIYFASEIKFIAALSGRKLEVNASHVLRYLVNGYKSLYKTTGTYFKGICEIPSASNAFAGSDLALRIEPYWQPLVAPQEMSLDDAIEGTRHHLLESMRIRLRSDVPLAFCLSGGVDSASLASIAAKHFKSEIATFSLIDQDERYNEYDNIKATIDDLGCHHTIIEVSRKGAFQRLKELIEYHDAPIATISYFIHSFLSEAIARQGYRVVFSGTSADELFTGYYDHFNLHLYEMRNHPDYNQYLQDWRKNTGRFVRNPYLQNPELYFLNQDIRDHIYLNSDEFAAYLKFPYSEPFTEKHYCDSLLRNRMLNELLHEVTPVILHEDDLNSMMYSIENRSPYLDSRMFSFAFSIPAGHLIQNGYGKYVLREAVKGILNDQVRLDRRKKGFNASINSIVDFDDPETRAFLLDDSPIFELVDRDKIAGAMKMNPVPNSYSKFLFNFINTKLFMEMNV